MSDFYAGQRVRFNESACKQGFNKRANGGEVKSVKGDTLVVLLDGYKRPTRFSDSFFWPEQDYVNGRGVGEPCNGRCNDPDHCPQLWIDDDENGIISWNGYTISQWTGEAWGPNDFYRNLGDIDATKRVCELEAKSLAQPPGE